MAQVIIQSPQVNQLYITEEEKKVVVNPIARSIATIITEGPQGNAAPGVPSFIQNTQPSVAELMNFNKYLWWDTTSGDLTLWIEDGTP